MQRAVFVGLLALGLFLYPGPRAGARPNLDVVPFSAVIPLFHQIATAPGLDRETISLALRELMTSLIEYLSTQGIAEEALAQVNQEFGRAIENFLYGGRQALFGEEIAQLARELASLAQAGEVQGLPVALLERIGIRTWAIEALLRGAPEMSGLEVASIAREIAGQALARRILEERGVPAVIPETPSLKERPGPPSSVPPVNPGPPEEEEEERPGPPRRRG